MKNRALAVARSQILKIYLPPSFQSTSAKSAPSRHTIPTRSQAIVVAER
jgi:hypothetical protein